MNTIAGLGYCSTLFLTASSLFLSTQAKLIAYEDRCNTPDNLDVAFATFNSNITSDGPLMWTISGGANKDSINKRATQYLRSFSISTPLSLNLADVTSFSGCGLYLFNVTSALQVSSNFTDYDSFTCDTVMPAQCQDDLLQQALDDLLLLYNITAPNSTDYFSCQHMGDRFASRPVPPSCRLQQPTWGETHGSYIAGRGFVERDITEPGQDCSINNDTSHNDLYGDSSYALLPTGSEAAKAFQNGTTPVITMFFTFPNTEQDEPTLPQPELHLTCLKTIPSVEEQAKINSAPNHLERRSQITLIMGLLVSFSMLALA